MTEVFNIAKVYKDSGPQKMFSILRCLEYQLTLFKGITVFYCINLMIKMVIYFLLYYT